VVKAAILAIGSEVTNGSTLDSNSAFLSQRLVRLGLQIEFHLAVQDDYNAIKSVLDWLRSKCDLILTTGGLGPTFDDITKPAIARSLDRELVFDENEFKRLLRFYKSRKKSAKHARKQVYYPKGAFIFPNNYGVAPAFGVEEGTVLMLSMPGVPREMKGIYSEQLEPYLKKRYRLKLSSLYLVAKLAGLTEVATLRKLGPTFPPKDENVSCGIYPAGGETVVRMLFRGKSRSELLKQGEAWKVVFIRKFGACLVDFSDQPIENILGKILKTRKQTLAIAESLTGGLVAQRITTPAGASTYFNGGVVTYSNETKAGILGIDEKLIKKHGAVSSQVARKMAESVRSKFKAAWGISTTGIAGPDTDASGKPIGTVFVALASAKGTLSRKYVLWGDREKIRWHASQVALQLLWSTLEHA